MTITELRKYLEELEKQGKGDYAVVFTVCKEIDVDVFDEEKLLCVC